MASVKLNGNVSPSNMLCFSDSYNILEYNATVTGTNAYVLFTVTGLSTNTDYYLTVLDETITSTDEVKNATNKRFYVSSNNATTAYYIARALRCCDSLNADWNITNQSNTVLMTAKTMGNKISSSDIDTNMNLSPYIVTGTSSNLYGGFVNLRLSGDTGTVELQKNISDNYTSFNISPLLASIAEYGKIKPFNTRLSNVTNDGTYQELLSGATNYVTYGYKTNYSQPFLPMTARMLINNQCDGDTLTLYTYSNIIDFSIIYDSNYTTYTWTAYRNDMSRIQSGTSTPPPSGNQLKDLSVIIPNNIFPQTYFVDISYGASTIRWNVIKPLKMTDKYTRVYWRNEYGGISFFDFTGSVEETFSVNMDTYNKNFYNYYRTSERAEKIPYKNESGKEITLRSHIIDAKGRYVAVSLINSKKAYIVGSDGYIYLRKLINHKSIDVNEIDGYKGLYEITYTFEYSI